MEMKESEINIYQGTSVRFFTDGTRSIKLKPGDTIPDNFTPGRTFRSNPWNKGLSAKTNEKVRKNTESAQKTREERGGYPAWNKGLSAKTDERVAKNVSSARATVKAKYGVDNIAQYISKQPDYVVWNKGLTKETDSRMQKASDNHKGVVAWNKGKHPDGHPQTEETREKIRKAHLSPECKKRRYQTMKENNTFCVHNSKAEEEFYSKLKLTYAEDDIVRQYFDKDRYPFKCDFYIRSEDRFIEIHATWTHGGRPFDPNDDSCIEQLEVWREKAKTSKYYRTAIYQWTDLDVRKLNTAIKNNLNFQAIYC